MAKRRTTKPKPLRLVRAAPMHGGGPVAGCEAHQCHFDTWGDRIGVRAVPHHLIDCPRREGMS